MKQGNESAPSSRMKRDLVFFNNPILVQGLALTPAIAAATTVKNALVLCAALLLIIVPTRVVCEFVLRYIGRIPRLRTPVYAIVAALVYIPAYFVLQRLFGTAVTSPGIYLPLLVMDGIVNSRSELAARESVPVSLRNGVMTCVGASLVMLLFGAVRELLTDGEIYDRPIIAKGLLPIAGTIAGGLILAAILTAVFQWNVIAYRRDRFIYEEDGDI